MKWRIAIIFLLLILVIGTGFFLFRESAQLFNEMGGQVTQIREDINFSWSEIDVSKYFDTGYLDTERIKTFLQEKSQSLTNWVKKFDYSKIINEYISLPLKDFEQELVTKLEENLDIELIFEEVDYWPLNRLTFKNIEFKRGQEVVITAQQLEINYNIVDILRKPGSWRNSLTSVNLINPQVDISRQQDLISEEDSSDSNYNFDDINDYKDEFGDVKIYFENGRFNFEDQKQQLEMEQINGTLGVNEKQQIALNVGSNLNLENATWGDHYVEELELKEVVLDFVLQEEKWESDIFINTFNPGLLTESSLQELLLSNSHYTLRDLKGQGKVFLNLTGQDFAVDNYRGRLDLANTGFRINVDSFPEMEPINDLEGSFFFNSQQEEAIFEGFNFSYGANEFQLEGGLENVFSGTPRLALNLGASDYSLSRQELPFDGLPEISGTGQIDLFVEGPVTDPVIDLETYFSRARVDGNSMEMLTGNFQYRDQLVYINSLEGNSGQNNEFSAEGVLNTDQLQYSLNLQGEKIQSELIEQYSKADVLNETQGQAGFELIVSGQGLDVDDLDISGDFNLSDFNIAGQSFSEAKTGVWFTDNILYFEEGQLRTPEGNVSFAGETNLKKQDLDFAFQDEELNFSLLEQLGDINTESIRGQPEIDGSITSTWDDPRVKMDIALPQGEVQDQKISDLRAEVVYEDKNVDFQQLKFNSDDTVITGQGSIDLVSQPGLKAQFSVGNLNYERISEYLDYSLPLNGNLEAELEVNGRVDNPEITGKLSSGDSSLLFGEPDYNVDSMELDFAWQPDAPLKINNFVLNREDTSLQASGEYQQQEFDLQYSLNNFDVGSLPLPRDIKGQANLTGQLTGSPASPVLTGQLGSESLRYDEVVLEDINSEFAVEDFVLKINELTALFDDSLYSLVGNINDLDTKDPGFDLEVATEAGNINSFTELVDIDLFFEDFQRDYYLAGKADIGGSVSDPRIAVDFSGYNGNQENGKITVKGRVARQLDLEIFGQDLEVSRFVSQIGDGFTVSGQTDFSGIIDGEFYSPNFEFETEVRDLKAGQIDIPKLVGNISMDSERKLALEQSVSFDQESSLDVAGNVFLQSGGELDFSVNSNQFPLNFLSRELEIKSLQGFLDGDVSVTGTIDDPELGGSLSVSSQDIDLGLPEKVSDLGGQLVFSGQAVEFNDFAATYGREVTQIGGRLNLFDFQNFWDLSFSGKNLLFDQGSFTGRFDPEMKFSGPFNEPRFTGEALVHNFIVQTPFEWSESETEDEGGFVPEIDIVLHPGREVYFESGDRVDVTIEEGDINLVYEDDAFYIDGQLESQEGSFTYYNNRFALEQATANFQRHMEYIPNLNVRASTTVEGTKVNAIVTGPADNMDVSFESQPQLAEDEILNLLAQRGGLGELVGKDNPVLRDVISREVIRFLQETFQLEFVENVSTRLRNIFELDTFEIDTYDMGLENRINLKMGKNLSDRLYLEYNSSITPEYRDDEISFKYRLRENTFLDGAWHGNDDYRISIETILDF
ncbi:MAG: translocation/assembly module TamB domain-containing protein [Bacillota bacterium]